MYGCLSFALVNNYFFGPRFNAKGPKPDFEVMPPEAVDDKHSTNDETNQQGIKYTII